MPARWRRLMEIFSGFEFVGKFLGAVLLLVLIGIGINLCLIGWVDILKWFAHALRPHCTK